MSSERLRPFVAEVKLVENGLRSHSYDIRLLPPLGVGPYIRHLREKFPGVRFECSYMKSRLLTLRIKVYLGNERDSRKILELLF